MINNIKTSRSAKFFRIVKPISDTFINTFFAEVSDHKVGNFEQKIVRQTFNSPIEAKVSFVIFKFKEEPSFLQASELKETRYGFCLLVEHNNFMVILRKHASGGERLIEARCSRMEYEEINGLFSQEDPSYEKMSMSHMGISKAAILRKTLESKDLRGQLAPQSSRRSIANFTTVKTKIHRHTLRPHNSSVSKADSSTGIKELLEWINVICIELAKGALSNQFLESFAQPVKFEKIKGEIVPTALLLNIEEIKDILQAGDGCLMLGGMPLSEKRLHRVLNILDSTFYVQKDGSLFPILFQKQSGDLVQVGALKFNDKSITISSDWLKNIVILHADLGVLNLQKLINSNQEFLVTFDSPEYVYKNYRVFRDKGIINHCSEIESALIKADFSSVKSEKGDHQVNQNAFDVDSLFAIVEKKIHNPKAILICDDLGDEWADYIEINDSPTGVRLFHCKHGRESTSASQLHEVVSQALKNVGRVSFNLEDVNRKMGLWRSQYSNTRINRIRTDHEEAAIIALVENLIKSPECLKEIALVVPFLKKDTLTAEFESLTKKLPVRPHISQLVWLLSSFISTCKESGIKPTIYCS